MWKRFNPNPMNKAVGDCVVRAIVKATGMSWMEVFNLLCDKGAQLYDMPSSNGVWGAMLRDMGFKRYSIPNSCPYCYTIRDFAEDHPDGLYILATGSHVVTCEDGCYYDSWDSGDEIPQFYYTEEN